jgi:hypothetical protein
MPQAVKQRSRHRPEETLPGGCDHTLGTGSGSDDDQFVLQRSQRGPPLQRQVSKAVKQCRQRVVLSVPSEGQSFAGHRQAQSTDIGAARNLCPNANV